MRVASFIFSMSRKARGMQVSVRDLTRSLHLLGVESTVLSLRDAWSDEDAGEWTPVEPKAFHVIGPSKAGYSPGLAEAARRLDLESLDLVHIHGLWQYPSGVGYRIAQGSGIPRIISPHGMLDPWALRRSAWKKRIAGRIWEDRNLRTADCLHALSDAEFRSIREFGLRNPVAVIPNGIALPGDVGGDVPDPVPPEWGNPKILLFLSRIHPKKGLVPLLHAWAGLGAARKGWKLVIAGPDEVGHLAELRALAVQLGILPETAFVGPQHGEGKDAWLRSADAFVLPSFSEGFPMAVLEAMACSLPVVLTTRCNLPAEEFAPATLVADPEPASLGDALARIMGIPDDERMRMGIAGKRIVSESYRWDLIARRMKAVYAWLAGTGPAPDDVRADG